MNHFDVIIIGTGAGGGTLAWALAGTGKKILLLERGDYLRREKENWDPKAVFEDQRYLTSELWYDGNGEAFRPEMHYYLGGQTKVYGAALLRLRSEDFGELRHRDGISPAWPLAYDDFEPYYAEAELLYRVHGERGIDPTEPPAFGAFPFPVLGHEPRIVEVAEGLRRAGLRPFPLPVALNRDEVEPHRRQLKSVFGARLEIVRLRLAGDPEAIGVKLLRYVTPPGGHPFPAGTRANDLVEQHLTLETSDVDAVFRVLRRARVHLRTPEVISFRAERLGERKAFYVLDPTGHPVEIRKEP